jgi:hypothetical protein
MSILGLEDMESLSKPDIMLFLFAVGLVRRLRTCMTS